MRFPEPQASHMYGNPEDVYAAKQAAAAREAKRVIEAAKDPVKRPTLTLKKEGWSEARKAAEALFRRSAA